jgi:hypothetical protein
MTILLKILTLLGLGALAKKWLDSRGTRKRDPMDAQIDEMIAEAMATKFSTSKEELLRAFQEESELTRRIRREVRGVELTFERNEARRYDLDVVVSFQEGRVRCSREVSWDWLPDEVRGEMLRTGAHRVRKTWSGPWTPSDPGS